MAIKTAEPTQQPPSPCIPTLPLEIIEMIVLNIHNPIHLSKFLLALEMAFEVPSYRLIRHVRTADKSIERWFTSGPPWPGFGKEQCHAFRHLHECIDAWLERRSGGIGVAAPNVEALTRPEEDIWWSDRY